MTENDGEQSERRAPGGDGGSLWGSAVRTALPRPIRRSYAAKFALAIVLVVLLIVGIGALSYVQIQGIIEEDAENSLRSTATVQADSVSEWISGMQSQAGGIAAADVYATGDQVRIRRHLTDSLAWASSDVTAVHYVDPQTGEIVASTKGDYAGRQVTSAAPAWQEPIGEAIGEGNGSVGMSDSAYEQNGRLLMAFARETRVGDGVVVVVGDARQDFEQLHESQPIVTTRLLNAEGYDVFSSRGIRPSPLAGTEAFESAQAGGTAIHQREDDVVSVAPVENTNWVVVTAAPKDRLYQASETVGRNVAVLVTSAVAILGVVGFGLGLGTVRSLRRLRERTGEMEEGNLDVDLSTTREDELGRLFVAFGHMRDALREQIREAEAARERAEASRRELARQNERLDQFASTVSHDLRNPLNVADGQLELLATRVNDAETVAVGEVRPRLEKISDAHDRMAAIIDDVLALAREGASVDDTETVDLESVANDAWENVEADEAWLWVDDTRSIEADRARLLRAFENLIRNSVEHAGPEVTIEVGATEDGFYLADDGPGIPPEEVEDVFEYGHTTEEDGTGFGLAIVETVVTAHGWEIDVDESHDGAKFVVSGVGPVQETAPGVAESE
ncbi:sensor histidine kinase [Halomicrobium salinisoli]|uniref:sensor histidine kinase n=1 Tax=Halomicrobium salinisoli TaxID=2878391 RepID=UPI001CF07DF1|nr:HAMP domain-containing sensor histidine kinase [Halomicrobium salinisoli]